MDYDALIDHNCTPDEDIWEAFMSNELTLEQEARALHRAHANADSRVGRALDRRERNLARARAQRDGVCDETHRGPCELCGRVPPPDGRANHWDHDHKTGRFRGWLCMDCNTGLGKFKDSPELLQKAIEYLKR